MESGTLTPKEAPVQLALQDPVDQVAEFATEHEVTGKFAYPEHSMACTVLRDAAERYVADYTGNFEYLTKMQGIAKMTDAQVKGVLNCMLADSRRRSKKAAEAQAEVPTVSGLKPSETPNGRYALEEDGVFVFYRVNKPTKGNWVGYTFVDRLIGSYGDYRKEPVRNPKKKTEVLARIATNPQEAMTRFGHESGNCGKCGAALSDPESLARGIGPVCATTLGWG